MTNIKQVSGGKSSSEEHSFESKERKLWGVLLCGITSFWCAKKILMDNYLLLAVEIICLQLQRSVLNILFGAFLSPLSSKELRAASSSYCINITSSTMFWGALDCEVVVSDWLQVTQWASWTVEWGFELFLCCWVHGSLWRWWVTEFILYSWLSYIKTTQINIKWLF